MNFLDALNISSSGLSAQRMRMNLISSNLANINTTRTDAGGPYKRKDAVFAAQPLDAFNRQPCDFTIKELAYLLKTAGLSNQGKPLL